MEIEETAGSEVGAELELHERVDIFSQQTQAIIPKHYNFQEASSEEDDDVVPGQALLEDCDDCVCCVCGANFAFFSSLIQHFNVHKGEVCCHLCQLRFSRVISLALHLKNAHPKYHRFCKSCKVMFRNTWHMNQHIERHSEMFGNGKAVEPDKATKPACSVKPVEKDMEEVVIETEQVEIMEEEEEEEEEVVLERMQETKANIIVTTKDDHIFSDHDYCCSQRLKSPIVSDESPAHNTHSNSQADANNILPDNLIYSPEEDTDTASYLSTALKKGSQRLQHKRKRLLSRHSRIRQTCANTSEKIINSVKVSAQPELVSSIERAFRFGKVRTDLESCSSNERGSSANINTGPGPCPAIAKQPNSVKIGSGQVLTFVTTKDDHIFSDHDYCCSQRLKSPIVSDESPAHNTHSNSQADAKNVKSINGQTLYVLNNKAYTKDAKEFVGNQKEKTQVLHSMLKREGMTDGCRAILQAACEKVLMSQNLGNKPPKKQETILKFLLSSPDPAAVEPVHQDLGNKVEEDDEDKVWECAHVEGDIKEVDEESDSSLLDNLIYSPEEDTDTASYLSKDFNSDALKRGSQRQRKRLLTRHSRIRQTCANTSEKLINSVKVSAQPEIVSSDERVFRFGLESCSSNEKASSANVKAGPEPSPAIAKPPNSVKIGSGHAPSLSSLNPLHCVKASAGSEPSSLKDTQICESCGLNKAPSEGKPMERCKCTQIFECYMCGVTCGRDHLLLKCQTEDHLLAKYICSNFLKTFPNQSVFAKQPCTKGPNGQPPSQSASSVKSPPSMVLKFVPSPNIRTSSKQTINNNGGSRVVPSLNVGNILDTSKKLTVLSNSALPVLSSNSSSAQRVPEQVSAVMTLNAHKEATNLVLKGVKDPATPVLMATQAKTGQMPLLIPTSSSASVKPTEVVFQGVVLPKRRPVCTSLAVSHSGTSASNQSKVALQIPIYPSIPNKVNVSFSPTPVQFPVPTHVSASSLKTLPSPSHSLVRPVTAPLLKPVPALATSGASTLVHVAAPAHLKGSSSASSTVSVPPPSEGPLSIVAMFVNQSQELALQKRMWQSWRSKAIFLCRHCGAVARQPALFFRHRYLHRGPRLHRCQCGKTFQRQLHLLRHQVQHAEAMRYVCAACGQTFQGTRKLTCHKQRKLFRLKPSNMKKSIRRECRNVFHCHCGQGFLRSSALLWHMLKNSRSDKRVKKFS